MELDDRGLVGPALLCPECRTPILLHGAGAPQLGSVDVECPECGAMVFLKPVRPTAPVRTRAAGDDERGLDQSA